MVVLTLEERRRRAGFKSREKLAAVTGLSAATIGRAENGEVTPNRSTWILLAQALGCTPEDLMPQNDRGPAGNGALVTADDADKARGDVLSEA